MATFTRLYRTIWTHLGPGLERKTLFKLDAGVFYCSALYMIAFLYVGRRAGIYRRTIDVRLSTRSPAAGAFVKQDICIFFFQQLRVRLCEPMWGYIYSERARETYGSFSALAILLPLHRIAVEGRQAGSKYPMGCRCPKEGKKEGEKKKANGFCSFSPRHSLGPLRFASHSSSQSCNS